MVHVRVYELVWYMYVFMSWYTENMNDNFLETSVKLA